MISMFCLIILLIMTFTDYNNPHIVIPLSTDGMVRLASTAVPKNFCPHSSDGALA